jgi:N-acetylated-alpha-linked acidic dipeptidase
MIPSWLGYAANGTVEGPVVYANYGTYDDFKMLNDTWGVQLKGTIALIRYGSIMRGTKVRNAQQFGCIGALLYSDPIDDGYYMGDIYPNGPWRSESGVQRGSILDISICAGNPSEERIKNECASMHQLVPAIPALPISYYDATPLLKALTNSSTPVPPSWQGALPFHYHYGPGESWANLTVLSTTTNKDCWNIAGEILGEGNEKDWIVAHGAHRDAWTFGGLDPISGTTVLLEVARVLGNLTRQGWKPKRTIQLFSWDSEEWGLIGSTAYAEKYAQNITKDMLIYFNVDVAVSNLNPSLSISASGGIIDVLTQSDLLKKITDPNTKLPMYNVWQKNVGTLGSGSDYAAFLHHLGVSSFDSSFSIGTSYGQYHAKYDDVDLLERYIDPEYAYHKTSAQIYALLLNRFATNTILPFGYNGYVQRLREYSIQLQAILAAQNIVLDLTELNDAIDDFADASASVTDEIKSLQGSQDQSTLFELNSRLAFTERKFLIPAGLPQRHWFKHILQAPGIQKGYGSVIFPGIDDALTYNNNNITQAITQSTEQLRVISDNILASAFYLRGGERPPTPLSDNTIIVVGIVGTLLVLFIFGVVVYFKWFRSRGDGGEESISLVKKDVSRI